jgi:SAM-dependent methyltransferase
VSNHRLFAALYDRITATSERAGFAAKRQELLAPLRGDVLEIGAGTGANLGHYEELTSLLCVEPDLAMQKHLRQRIAAASLSFPVEVDGCELGRDRLPLADAGVDAVVSTLVLCTVGDVPSALAEIRRVLRPGGALVLIEHVRNAGPSRTVQTALTPIQRLLAGGCNLNRDTKQAVASAGFDVGEIQEWKLPGSVPLLRRAIAGSAHL